MKITKSQLKQIIKEEIESLPIDNLIGGINGLVQGMDPELVGVVFTTVFRQLEGEESPVEQQPEEEPQPKTPIGFDRKPESPSGQAPTRIGFEEQLRKMIKEDLEEILGAQRQQVAKNTPIVIGTPAPGYVWDKVVGGYVHQNYKGRRLSRAEEQQLDAAVKAYQASSLREEET